MFTSFSFCQYYLDKTAILKPFYCKKIKRAIGAQGGGRIADAARRAQIHGFYSPDMGMRGRDPRMAMRGRGYAKGGLIKGKPKLAVKGW